MILHGQTHGGIAQGVGQALIENVHYDPATGQFLAASFMDYAMPRADLLPLLDTAVQRSSVADQPLGVAPGGEGGTTPALAVASTRSSMRSPSWACAISKCRPRPSGYGAPSRPQGIADEIFNGHSGARRSREPGTHEPRFSEMWISGLALRAIPE